MSKNRQILHVLAAIGTCLLILAMIHVPYYIGESINYIKDPEGYQKLAVWGMGFYILITVASITALLYWLYISLYKWFNKLIFSKYYK